MNKRKNLGKKLVTMLVSVGFFAVLITVLNLMALQAIRGKNNVLIEQFEQYEKAVEKSRAAEAITGVRSIKNAQEVYFLANGEYTNDLNNLDVQMTGGDGNYNGVARKESKNYSFAASTSIGALPNTIAYANRFPLSEKYGIAMVAGDDSLYCKFYSPAGEKICKTFGGTKLNDSVYKMP